MFKLLNRRGCERFAAPSTPGGEFWTYPVAWKLSDVIHCARLLRPSHIGYTNLSNQFPQQRTPIEIFIKVERVLWTLKILGELRLTGPCQMTVVDDAIDEGYEIDEGDLSDGWWKKEVVPGILISCITHERFTIDERQFRSKIALAEAVTLCN